MTTPSRTLGCKATALLWMGAAAALWWSMAALRPPASGICAIYLAVHRGQCSWRWNGCIWSACGYGGQSASHREGDLLAVRVLGVLCDVVETCGLLPPPLVALLCYTPCAPIFLHPQRPLGVVGDLFLLRR